MNWIYILTWTIYLTVPCAPKYEVDEFGNRAVPKVNVIQSRTYNAVICFTTKAENKKKEFTNRDSAFAFMNRGMDNGISFKIDSIKAK